MTVTSAWGGRGQKFLTLKKFARRVADAPVTERREEAARVGAEMLVMLEGMSCQTKRNSFTDLRSETRKVIPDVSAWDLPRCPDEIFAATKTQGVACLNERTNNKIIVDADKLIKLVVAGVKDGMERRQVPQVLFCIGYLIGLCPNDFNTQKKRADETVSCLTDFQYIEGATSGEDELVIVGSIKNTRPSKENRSKNYVGAYATSKDLVDAYTTGIICDTEDHDLIKDAITWAMDSRNAGLPCITTRGQYIRGDASGAEPTGKEWRNGRSSGWVMGEMIKRLGLNECVEDWGVHKGGFTKALGRSFVACCVEQGRLEFNKGLTPSHAVELTLGHMPLSSSNVNYLKFDCRPCTPVAGVMAVKVCKENPIGDVTYGICLVKKQD
jgi:hypothetical protein